MTDRRRSRHPARSARILATGAAISATLGLTSALRIAEARATHTEPSDGTPLPSSGAADGGTVLDAPSDPAPAAPPSTATAVEPAVTPTTAAAPAPVVVVVPESPPQWVPPQTSGSN